VKKTGIDVVALAEERAKDLLVLSLAHRDDLAVLETRDLNGFDFLCRVAEGRSLNTNKLFWIELKASVREPNGPRVRLSQDRAVVYAESRLPLCLFFYSMSDDIGYYVWMVEPTVTSTGKPELTINRRLVPAPSSDVELNAGDFTKVDPQSIAQVVASVNSYYDAVHQAYLEAA